MSSPTPLKQTLHIEKLVYGGNGLARLSSSEVVFVSGGLPGETAVCEILNSAKKPLQAKVLEVLESSDERISPSCSVFGQCGGCDWQHLTTSAQREWKRRIIAESLSRIGKIRSIPEILPLLPEEGGAGAWHYRNKVLWSVDWVNNQPNIGYYAEKSREPVPFEHCWIMPEPLNEMADWLRGHLCPGWPINRIQARMNRRNESLFTFFINPPPLRVLDTRDYIIPCLQSKHLATKGELSSQTVFEQTDFMNALTRFGRDMAHAFPGIQGLLLRTGSQKHICFGTDKLIEIYGGKSFVLSDDSFFQINPVAADSMLTTLKQWLIRDCGRLLDCYAGVGAFAVSLAEHATEITAVESSMSAVSDAMENIRLNRCQNIQLLQGEAEKVLTGYPACPDIAFDAAIVDPPRTGCHPDFLEWLSRYIDTQIIYISCDPTTLARDLRFLTEQAWQIQSIQPIDMFPQTYHIETIVNLRKGIHLTDELKTEDSK